MNDKMVRKSSRAKEMEMEMEMQIRMLTKKNIDLAKRLAEKEIACAETTKLAFHQQNCAVQKDGLIVCYREKFKRILASISMMSGYLASVGEECTNVLQEYNNLGAGIKGAGRTSENKTQLVKPMVGGHTIRRPTIKLPRVSSEELVRMNNIADGDIVDEDDENDDIDDDVDEEEGEDVQEEEEDQLDENNRLLTLNEEDEMQSFESSADHLQNETQNMAPLLSGVFKDVKVYISPMRGNISHKRGNSSSLQRANNSPSHDSNTPVRITSSVRSNSRRPKSTLATRTSSETSYTRPSVSMSAGNSSLESNESSYVERNSIDTKDRLSPNSNRLSRTLRDSLADVSTFCNADLETTYQSELTSDQKSLQISGISIETNSKVPVASSRLEDYDPLEGPSTLLNNTENDTTFKPNDLSFSIENGSQLSAKLEHLSMLNLVPNLKDNTSTPYTPAGKKRRLDQVAQENKENSISQQTPRHVTKRRGKKTSSADMTKLTPQQYRDCSVMMERLPVSTLNALTTFSSNSSASDETSRKTKNNVVRRSKPTKSSEENLASARPRRSRAPVSLKEPSCRKKMRRSK